ncbi:lysozyme [Streptomyces sp. NBS 14/10]|uniref:lysozyme n=1 Tax=Streptomyces sp. NBS 14/10 TaxID=1945643 RepID=UPI000B7F7F4A|nr:lysozyme [Streptomyces sp. NBS 14/10]KAK1182099.1 lysozyme [Streptomyces sp. NBS 14/10]NUS84391.1 lysozyme [Streptomyces sp.]
MPKHRPGTTRRTLTALIGILAGLLAMSFTLSGTASAAQGKSGKAIPHPEDDWAGSQILKHEGGSTTGEEPKGLLATVEGVDVSSHQGNVAWATLWSSGVRFAYVKATEGTTYTNPYFSQQYNGSYNVGMIRGSYHFALPDNSSGAAQATYFVNHGGGWSKDGKTLPGALDMEYNPYGATCYGKSASAMVSWIKDFSNTYKSLTGRDPVIYTSTSWWKSCTGNSSAFGGVNPLWIPRYGSSVGELPAGWGFHTIWQYTSSGATVGDHNKFNGAIDRVQALANG